MVDEPNLERVRAWRRLTRRAARWLLERHGSAHSVALGFAIGVFVALTPTVGLQLLVSLVVASVVRANRPIPMALAWLARPLAVLPIYYFNYRVGLLLVPGDSAAGLRLIDAMAHASLSDPASMLAALRLGAHELWGVAGALWAGSLVVASSVALLTYPVVRWLVEVERAQLQAASTIPSLPPPEAAQGACSAATRF
jgi:hypothetical protein